MHGGRRFPFLFVVFSPVLCQLVRFERCTVVTKSYPRFKFASLTCCKAVSTGNIQTLSGWDRYCTILLLLLVGSVGIWLEQQGPGLCTSVGLLCGLKWSQCDESVSRWFSLFAALICFLFPRLPCACADK